MFPLQFLLPVPRFMQENQEEPDDMIRRINQLINKEPSRSEIDRIPGKNEECF